MSLRDQLLKQGFAPSAPAAAPAPDAPPTEAPTWAAKVVVRASRKGHGGKTVTTISGITAGREGVLARIKRELGSGGRLEGEDLVIQGDVAERVARWLESQGVPKVVRG